jgi:hypothetical protein
MQEEQEPLDDVVAEPSTAAILAEDLPLPPPPKKKMSLGLKIALGLTALVLFGAAAFFGGRLLSGQGLGGGSSQLTYTDGNGNTVTAVQIDMDPAPELPEEKSITSGILIRREDNSLFLGTGGITAVGSADGEVTFQHDGPEVEVVVNHDTQLYQDITDMDFSSGEKIQQKVKAGTIEDLHTNSVINVWGEKQGDRIIAKTLLYR